MTTAWQAASYGVLPRAGRVPPSLGLPKRVSSLVSGFRLLSRAGAVQASGSGSLVTRRGGMGTGPAFINQPTVYSWVGLALDRQSQ